MLVGAFAFALLIVDGALSDTIGGKAPATVALSLATAAPLVLRRRAPVGVLLTVGAGVVACMAVFAPYWGAMGTAMIALYSVGVTGGRRRSLLVGVATALALVAVFAALEATGNVGEGAMRQLLFALGALVVGDAVRSRRQLQAATADRLVRERREREAQARRSLDEERMRIARELHDSLAHALVAINVRAGVSARTSADRESASVLTEIAGTAAAALSDLRATLNVLRDDADAARVQPAEDLSALAFLISSARAGGLDARAEVDLAGGAVTTAVAHAGYRVVQEALTNVLRHSEATRARVTVSLVADALDIEILDDGHGARGTDPGHGLRGMDERVSALGGSVTAGPRDRGGWRVHARLPLDGTGRR